MIPHSAVLSPTIHTRRSTSYFQSMIEASAVLNTAVRAIIYRAAVDAYGSIWFSLYVVYIEDVGAGA